MNQNQTKYQSKNINSELMLLIIDIDDYEGKFLVATAKADNEKDLNEQLSLIRNLSAINLKEIKNKELLARMVRKISCFSEVSFISSLIPKDNIEVNEQKVLSLFSGLSREELIKLFQENNEVYLSGCCKPCQEDFWKIKLKKDQEALGRFFICLDINCNNSGFVMKDK